MHKDEIHSTAKPHLFKMRDRFRRSISSICFYFIRVKRSAIFSDAIEIMDAVQAA